MGWADDFLNRFRRAGTPGGAARAGVPVDRATEAAAELQAVLALLVEAESAGSEIRQRAERDAEELREQARTTAASLVAEARARAAAERADAAAAARADSQAESAQLTAEAGRRAAARRELAEERLPDYVARVVAMVRDADEEQTEAGADR
jgi:F0F1-type ATP synthase membrane subunit b/b'